MYPKLKVNIICDSCEHMNKEYAGTKGYEMKETEFHSLTDAVQHIVATAYVHHVYLTEVLEEH